MIPIFQLKDQEYLEMTISYSNLMFILSLLDYEQYLVIIELLQYYYYFYHYFSHHSHQDE